ncbi:hypothetical protein OC844_006627 [Tilletia horrida]|nr:hypothetical protein OC844_006627 [Tilletia horrida]
MQAQLERRHRATCNLRRGRSAGHNHRLYDFARSEMHETFVIYSSGDGSGTPPPGSTAPTQARAPPLQPTCATL